MTTREYLIGRLILLLAQMLCYTDVQREAVKGCITAFYSVLQDEREAKKAEREERKAERDHIADAGKKVNHPGIPESSGGNDGR